MVGATSIDSRKSEDNENDHNNNTNTLGTSPFQQASQRLGSPVSKSRTFSRGQSPPAINDSDETPKRASSSTRGSFAHNGASGSMNHPVLDSGDSNSDDNVLVDIDNPDPEVVRVVGRHLVGDRGRRRSGSNSSGNSRDISTNNDHHLHHNHTSGSTSRAGDEDDSDEFDSLQLQGGDITRQLYNWQREHQKRNSDTRASRSKSFTAVPGLSNGNGSGASNLEPALDVRNIKAPGGMRRSFLQQKRNSFGSTSTNGRPSLLEDNYGQPRPFFTRNFIEFLTLYGHFAGEELEEEDEDELSDEFDEEALLARRQHAGPSTERSALIPKRRKSYQAQSNKASTTKAVMLLLKSFVGTGVLFLPKAYSNGGLLFCSVLLCLISIVSYWCFLLLIASKDKVGVSSFGDIGGELYGPRMREIILASIVLSQIGFAAAYIVFVSENLQALISALSGSIVPIEKLIAAQLLLFLPCSMVRDIAKLSFTALIADLFILLGLVYLYVWGVGVVVNEGVGPDLKMFNADTWTLFIGTAIFTFEGIGLIIPIQESMKRPQDFHGVLAGVMVAITIVFVSMGALQYAAYGSEVKTVILLNLPQDSAIVNVIQLLYALAIMLSTPLQLFPAIRILENALFKRSGKFNPKIKWEKNVFRFFLTICTAIVAWGGADDLDKFVALVGSFACIPLVYIYPPMLHMRAVKQGPIGLLGDVLLCVFGFAAMVYTTGMTVQSWVKH